MQAPEIVSQTMFALSTLRITDNGQEKTASQPILVRAQDIYGFIYRCWVKNRGVPHDQFDGRPVIGICNTWSELTPCNTHFRVIAEHVQATAFWKRAVFRWNSR